MLSELDAESVLLDLKCCNVFRKAKLSKDQYLALVEVMEVCTYDDEEVLTTLNQECEPALYIVLEGGVWLERAGTAPVKLPAGCNFGEDLLLLAEEAHSDTVTSPYTVKTSGASTCAVLTIEACRAIFNIDGVEKTQDVNLQMTVKASSVDTPKKSKKKGESAEKKKKKTKRSKAKEKASKTEPTDSEKTSKRKGKTKEQEPSNQSTSEVSANTVQKDDPITSTETGFPQDESTPLHVSISSMRNSPMKTKASVDKEGLNEALDALDVGFSPTRKPKARIGMADDRISHEEKPHVGEASPVAEVGISPKRRTKVKSSLLPDVAEIAPLHAEAMSSAEKTTEPELSLDDVFKGESGRVASTAARFGASLSQDRLNSSISSVTKGNSSFQRLGSSVPSLPPVSPAPAFKAPSINSARSVFERNKATSERQLNRPMVKRTGSDEHQSNRTWAARSSVHEPKLESELTLRQIFDQKKDKIGGSEGSLKFSSSYQDNLSSSVPSLNQSSNGSFSRLDSSVPATGADLPKGDSVKAPSINAARRLFEQGNKKSDNEVFRPTAKYRGGDTQQNDKLTGKWDSKTRKLNIEADRIEGNEADRSIKHGGASAENSRESDEALRSTESLEMKLSMTLKVNDGKTGDVMSHPSKYNSASFAHAVHPGSNVKFDKQEPDDDPANAKVPLNTTSERPTTPEPLPVGKLEKEPLVSVPKVKTKVPSSPRSPKKKAEVQSKVPWSPEKKTGAEYHPGSNVKLDKQVPDIDPATANTNAKVPLNTSLERPTTPEPLPVEKLDEPSASPSKVKAKVPSSPRSPKKKAAAGSKAPQSPKKKSGAESKVPRSPKKKPKKKAPDKEISSFLSAFKTFENKVSGRNESRLPRPPKNVYQTLLQLPQDYKTPTYSKSKEEEEQIRRALSKRFVFQNLPEKTTDAMVHAFKKQKVPAGNRIITQGEVDDYFYVVSSGECAFEVDGKEKASAKAGDSFGEDALVFLSPRDASVLTKTETEVFRIDQKSFRRILQSESLGDTQTKIQILEKIQFLQGSTPENFKKLARIMKPVSFAKGDYLAKRANYGSSFYMVTDGEVECQDVTFGKRTKPNEILGPGEHFGKGALVEDPFLKADVVALSDGKGYKIDRAKRDALLSGLDRIPIEARCLHAVKAFERKPFKPLKHEEILNLSSLLRNVSFSKGETIIEADTEKEAAVYFLRDGVVHSFLGREILLLTSGTHFGESLFEDAKKKKQTTGKGPERVVAEKDCVCGILRIRDYFEAFGMKYKDTVGELTSKPVGEKKMSRRSSVGPTTASELDKKVKKKAHCKVARENLDKRVCLGEGAFGQIWLCADKTESKPVPLVLKIMSKAHLVEEGEAEMCIREKKMLMDVSHPFIVDLITTYNEESFVFMLMEYIQGGELFSVMNSVDGRNRLDEKQAKFYALVVADALSYLHQKKYIFRDLKPENVMIDVFGYPKLIDFGFGKKITEDTFTLCGTPGYLAPELVLGTGHNWGVDHWALGVLIYEMLAAESPFYEDGIEQFELFRSITEDEYPPVDDISADAEDLLEGLLRKDPTDRLGSLASGEKDILKHPWFDGMSLTKLRERRIEPPWIPKVSDPFDASNFDDWSDLDDKMLDPGPKLTAEDAALFEGF